MVVREAVTNIIRHADAGDAELVFSRQGDVACLAIEDDGRGDADPSGGGLSGLRARLEALGGALDVAAGNDGRGTVLTATLPTLTQSIGAQQ